MPHTILYATLAPSLVNPFLVKHNVLILGFLFLLFEGFRGTESVIGNFPNQGVWQSAINGGILLLIGGTIGWLTQREFGISSSLMWNTVLMPGMFVAIGCIQHFTLRLILWLNGYIPWNYARFLNYATERLFLQRVGGRYRFIHALLREHFAQMHRDGELQIIVQQEQTWKCVHTLIGHQASVNSVAISPDGQTLVSGSSDKTIKIWHLYTGKLIKTLTTNSNLSRVLISPDGQFLASSGSSDKTIKIWHFHTGKLLHTLTGHSDTVYSIAISPDSRILASASLDKTVKLWHLGNGELLHTLTGHSDSVYSIAISFDGQTIVSGDEKGQIKLWNLHTAELLCTLTEASGKTLPRGLRRFLFGSSITPYPFSKFLSAVYSVALSPDGQILASGNADKTIKSWQLGTVRQLYARKLPCTIRSHLDPVNSIAISLDGQTLISGSWDKTIRIWNLGTGELLNILRGHSGAVFHVVISPDSQTLVSSSVDKTIRIWRRPQN